MSTYGANSRHTASQDFFRAPKAASISSRSNKNRPRHGGHKVDAPASLLHLPAYCQHSLQHYSHTVVTINSVVSYKCLYSPCHSSKPMKNPSDCPSCTWLILATRDKAYTSAKVLLGGSRIKGDTPLKSPSRGVTPLFNTPKRCEGQFPARFIRT